MQRKRGSSGLNWKPHRMLCGAGRLPCCSGVMSGFTLPLGPDLRGGRSYAISVGTLSDVMPLPPGHLQKGMVSQ